MAAMEYYQSAPGQSFASDPPTLVGKADQPVAPTQVPSSTPHKPPSKAGAEDYFSPHAPNSAFVPAYVANAPPINDDVLPVPPPRISNPGKVASPPVVQDPTSPVTDESDGSVVHIHHAHQAPHHYHDDTTPNTNTSPPPPSPHQSGTLSLTHSNLQDHDGFGSSDRSPSHGRGPASKKRLRPRELSTHSKDTLIQLLIRQEYQVDDCKKALKNALEKLERYKSDLADANSHCRRVEKLYQKLADERMLMQTQVNDTIGKAQQQSYAAQQELSIFKLKLEHAENALASAKAEMREVKLQRDKARSDAERSREEAHRMREDRNVREAREQGRKLGYDEGVKQGHVLGITQTVPPATTTTSAGEPPTSQVPAPAPSNPNTSVTSSHSRARTATSQSDKRSSPSNRTSKTDIEDLAQKIRRETEERYQRQFDQQLAQERQRLQILKLEQDRERDRELAEERERFRQSVEAREHQRSAELEAEIETLRQLERQRSEEVKNEQQKLSVLQVERDKERELKEKEQRERQRERQEREQERAEEARRHEQEQRNASRQKQIERTEAMQRDRERDRAVAEATAQAAKATAQANAAATASASRPKSRAASASSSGSDHGRTPRNQSYFPMPRPPMGMPIPEVPPSRVVQASMAMPEPNVNRSARSPQAPVTIPASISMPEPNVNPGGGYSSQPAVSMPEPYSSRSPVPVSMPEPNVNPGGRYSSQPAVSMPEPYSSRSPVPVSMPEPNVNYSSRSSAAVSMPEPSIGGRSSRSPRAPSMPEPSVNRGMSMPEPSVNRGVSMPQPSVNRGVTMPQPNINTGSHWPQAPVTVGAAVSMPEPNTNSTDYSRPSSRSAGHPANLPSTIPGRHRARRSSMESQSSVSTVAGGLDKLVSFPVPGGGGGGGGGGRTPSNSSGGGGPAFIPPLPEASGRNNNNRQSSHSRSGTYTRPNVAGLSDIPEDASFRLSPGVTRGGGPVIPSAMGVAGSDASSGGGPVIPNIRIEGDDFDSEDDDQYLHAPPGPGLRRSDSGPSVCGITVEPPSGPGTPLEGGPAALHHHHHHHHSSADPNLLSPNHIPHPVLPQVPPQQPVLPRRAESPALPIRVNVRGGVGGEGGRERVIPTQPNTPVIPNQSNTPVIPDAQYLPPNFIPQSFTPHANVTPALPEVVMNPPPGFIPQSVTDVRTGVTTPLMSMNALPSGDEHAGGGGGSRRQSIYGASGTSPYIGSPSQLSGGGPPVIPTFGDMDYGGGGGGSNRGTPRSGMYTPGGSTRGLPGSSVYQNPGEGDEDEENDDLVARNTRINATAPLINTKQKKKKKR